MALEKYHIGEIVDDEFVDAIMQATSDLIGGLADELESDEWSEGEAEIIYDLMQVAAMQMQVYRTIFPKKED